MNMEDVKFGVIPEYEIKSHKTKGYRYIIMFDLYPRSGGDDYYRWFYSKEDPNTDKGVLDILQHKVLRTAQIVGHRIIVIDSLSLSSDN